MFAQNEIISAVWRKLNADSTLQGASYLGGAGKIWTGSKRPMQTDNPLLTIEGSRQLNESLMERWELIIKAYADDSDNGTADLTKLGNITNRVADLLHNADMTISGGRIHTVYFDSSSEAVYDPQHQKEHRQESIFRMFAIKST
ncbi:MAG: hypothetical protein IH880_08205 [Candidatus Marinimicrobia bacterium]|nr:hypothetical protein [Candidatus Neomarinimicrobiota bacterium]